MERSPPPVDSSSTGTRPDSIDRPRAAVAGVEDIDVWRLDTTPHRDTDGTFDSALDAPNATGCASCATAMHVCNSAPDAGWPDTCSPGRTWVRKEAFVKALGTGVATGFDRFDVSTGAEPALTGARIDGICMTEWSIRDLFPAPGYVAAVAVHATQPRVRTHDIGP